MKIMKKLLSVLFVCVFALCLVVACGDDDEGGGGTDNVAACKAAATKIGELKCGTTDMTVYEKALKDTCDNYGSTTCDISDFWDCYGSCYKCKDMSGTKVIDATACTDCANKATCK